MDCRASPSAISYLSAPLLATPRLKPRVSSVWSHIESRHCFSPAEAFHWLGLSLWSLILVLIAFCLLLLHIISHPNPASNPRLAPVAMQQQQQEAFQANSDGTNNYTIEMSQILAAPDVVFKLSSGLERLRVRTTAAFFGFDLDFIDSTANDRVISKLSREGWFWSNFILTYEVYPIVVKATIAKTSGLWEPVVYTVTFDNGQPDITINVDYTGSLSGVPTEITMDNGRIWLGKAERKNQFDLSLLASFSQPLLLSLFGAIIRITSSKT